MFDYKQRPVSKEFRDNYDNTFRGRDAKETRQVRQESKKDDKASKKAK